ncbi:MAG: YeeE/YedE family protein, partial [Gammaproteobacteria bacterium]
MQSFSPLAAALGGTLIGLAAALLWAGSGRIAGVSGIFGQMLPPSHIAWWRLAFLGGLVLGAFGAARLAALAGFGLPVPRLFG